jgi:hypothetical protein
METVTAGGRSISTSRPRLAWLIFGIAAAAMPVLVILLWLLVPLETLELWNATTGAVLRRWPVSDGTLVELEFTHSIYGGEVRETYRVSTGYGLILVQVASTPGNIEYYALTSYRVNPDGWAQAAVWVPLASLVMVVDEVGQPVLSVGSAHLPLMSLVPSGGVVGIRLAYTPRALAFLSP